MNEVLLSCAAAVVALPIAFWAWHYFQDPKEVATACIRDEAVKVSLAVQGNDIASGLDADNRRALDACKESVTAWMERDGEPHVRQQSIIIMVSTMEERATNPLEKALYGGIADRLRQTAPPPASQ